MAYANAYKRGREEGRAATGVSGECRSEHEQSPGGPSAHCARASGPRDARSSVEFVKTRSTPLYIFPISSVFVRRGSSSQDPGSGSEYFAPHGAHHPTRAD